MAYVNMRNDSEAVQVCLAIVGMVLCVVACVGIIVLWRYLIQGGEVYHGLGTDPLATNDCICFILSKAIGGKVRKHDDEKEMARNPVINMTSASSEDRAALNSR